MIQAPAAPRWVWRVGLVAAGLVFGLLAAEVVVRGTRHDPLGRSLHVGIADSWNTACTRLSPGVVYELIPGRCGANELGMRDRAGVGVRKPGELRILALGDSISADGAWTELLEAQLGARLGRPVQVLNLGVTGYSIFNELEVYRRRGKDLDADAVILQVCLNDYWPTPIFLRSGDRLLKVEDQEGEMPRLFLPLFTHSALYRFLLVQFVGRSSQPLELRGQAGDVALSQVLDLARARNQPAQITVFPHLGPLGNDTREQVATAERVARVAASRETPLVDLRPIFEDVGFEQLRLTAGPRAWADLDGTLARLGLPEEATAQLLSVDPAQTRSGLEEPSDLEDRVHPNFLGHYLAARAIADQLVGEPSWAGLLGDAPARAPDED